MVPVLNKRTQIAIKDNKEQAPPADTKAVHKDADGEMFVKVQVKDIAVKKLEPVLKTAAKPETGITTSETKNGAQKPTENK